MSFVETTETSYNSSSTNSNTIPVYKTGQHEESPLEQLVKEKEAQAQNHAHNLSVGQQILQGKILQLTHQLDDPLGEVKTYKHYGRTDTIRGKKKIIMGPEDTTPDNTDEQRLYIGMNRRNLEA